MSNKPTDQLLDHEYDGIREYDNPIPAWWTWMWISTMIFSAVYFVHYHVTGTGESVLAAYEREVNAQLAKESEHRKDNLGVLSETMLSGMMRDEAMVTAGATKYAAICAACHGVKGEGTVGPNLTDVYWLHADGTLLNIREIVAQGVPEKGMPAWEKLMSPEELNQVVVYVGTLLGTNAEGKLPQGEEHKPVYGVDKS